MKKLFAVLAITVFSLGIGSAAYAVTFPIYDGTDWFESYLQDYIDFELGGDGTTAAEDLRAALGTRTIGTGVGVGEVDNISYAGPVLLEATIFFNLNTITDDQITEIGEFLFYIGTEPGDFDSMWGLFQNGIQNEGDLANFRSGSAVVEVYSNPRNPGEGTSVPIDGGLSFLALGGIAFGVRRFRKNS